MKKKVERLDYDAKLSEDVYWKLVEMKFKTRARSVDEVLRVLLGMPANHTRVKHYSHEGSAPWCDGETLSATEPVKINIFER